MRRVSPRRIRLLRDRRSDRLVGTGSESAMAKKDEAPDATALFSYENAAVADGRLEK